MHHFERARAADDVSSAERWNISETSMHCVYQRRTTRGADASCKTTTSRGRSQGKRKVRDGLDGEVERKGSSPVTGKGYGAMHWDNLLNFDGQCRNNAKYGHNVADR